MGLVLRGGFSHCFRGTRETLADFFLLFQAPGQSWQGLANDLAVLPTSEIEMSADGGGTRAAQDKERALEVWTGCWVRDVCPGRTGSRRGLSRQGA